MTDFLNHPPSSPGVPYTVHLVAASARTRDYTRVWGHAQGREAGEHLGEGGGGRESGCAARGLWQRSRHVCVCRVRAPVYVLSLIHI